MSVVIPKTCTTRPMVELTGDLRRDRRPNRARSRADSRCAARSENGPAECCGLAVSCLRPSGKCGWFGCVSWCEGSDLHQVVGENAMPAPGSGAYFAGGVGARRGIQVQANDIDELFLEPQVVADLERSTFHALRVWSAQILATASLPIPSRAARVRVLHCVDPSAERSLYVSCRTYSTVPTGLLGLRARLLAILRTTTVPARRNENASAAVYPNPQHSGGRSPRWPPHYIRIHVGHL